jgi:hypothetical protein
MSGNFSLLDFVKTKPGKSGGNKRNNHQNPPTTPNSVIKPQQSFRPHILQMENEMRNYLNQLLEKMYQNRRREEIIEKLIQWMREDPREFQHIFDSYRIFYDNIAQIDATIQHH